MPVEWGQVPRSSSRTNPRGTGRIFYLGGDVMKHRVGLGLTLAVCAAAEAAEPLSTAPAPAPVDATIPAPAPAAPPRASKRTPGPESPPPNLSICASATCAAT